MATPRKTSARSKKAAKKPAVSSKKVKKAGAAPPTSRRAAPATKVAAKKVKAAASPAKDKKAAAAKPAAVIKAAVIKAKVVARGGAGARKGAAGATPEVRPLGVLPPGSIARGSGKPAAIPAHPAPSSSRGAVLPAAAAQAQRVSESELKDFEQRLLSDRQRILKEMGHLENTVLKINQRDSAGDLSGYSFHMADVGTDAMEREKAFLFASAEGRTLLEINEALRRLYRGEYGMCESCGQPIGRPRLEAMPHARLCLACKAKEERTNRGVV